MQLVHGLHLGYSTNVHRGETWAETLRSLEQHTLRVKAAVCPNAPYGIGLRLSDVASQELSDPGALLEFQRWLDRNHCYVFTINGFPFGSFHGSRVKENVYRPDWTCDERVSYTNRLFDLLTALLPEGTEGSVSTSPGSFKEFITTAEQEQQMRDNFWKCVEHVAALSGRTGADLHLGIEPEPLGYIENTGETLQFFESMQREHPKDPRLARHLGVNYDTCHFAVEFEDAHTSLSQLQDAGIRLSKVHLSNALRLNPTPDNIEQLRSFADDVYLHQVIARHADGTLRYFKDIEQALALHSDVSTLPSDEWRVHFHVPLHAPPVAGLHDTRGHITDTLKFLSANPTLCRHLEMETYTWEVLPEPLRSGKVEDQLIAEYGWTLRELDAHGFALRSGEG